VSDLLGKTGLLSFWQIGADQKWHIGLCRKNVLGAEVLPKRFWMVSPCTTRKYQVLL